jgi:hypothetical protein
MSVRFSDAAIALQIGDVGLRRALSNASITFFTGSQPASANTGYGTSQPIISFTNADAQLVPETRARWEVTFSDTTASDTLDTLLVGGISLISGVMTAATTSDSDLAEAVALNINSSVYNLGFTATANGGLLTVIAPIGTGDKLNTAILSGTATGITLTLSSAGATTTSGVTSTGGLIFDSPVAYNLGFELVKPSGQTWSGRNGFGPAESSDSTLYSGVVNGTTYTAGWARILCSPGDTGVNDTSGEDGYIRVDLSVGASGSDILMSPAATFYVDTTYATSMVTALNSFRVKVPLAKS